MSYTHEQENIINLINKNKSVTIYDLLQINKKFDFVERKVLNLSLKPSLKEMIFSINENETEEILNMIAGIDTLCFYLQSNMLINILNIRHDYTKTPFCVLKDGIHEDVNKLNITLEKYSEIKYFASPTLETYITNCYKTDNQVELIEERKARKKSEKFTKVLALLTLLIGGSSIVFNILNYTKQSAESITVDPIVISSPLEINNLDKLLELHEQYLIKINEIINANNIVK